MVTQIWILTLRLLVQSAMLAHMLLVELPPAQTVHLERQIQTPTQLHFVTCAGTELTQMWGKLPATAVPQVQRTSILILQLLVLSAIMEPTHHMVLFHVGIALPGILITT